MAKIEQIDRAAFEFVLFLQDEPDKYWFLDKLRQTPKWRKNWVFNRAREVLEMDKRVTTFQEYRHVRFDRIRNL